jgi:hypothetical protein
MPRQDSDWKKRLAELIAREKRQGINALASYEAEIQRACEAFGFDPQNLFHRQYLLGLLANFLFKAERGPGTPVEWTPQRLRALIADIMEVIKEGEVPPSPLKLARRLQRKFRKKYPGKDKSLARLLREGPRNKGGTK